MTEPYYTDGQVTLYLGDCREILPTLDLQADLIVTDPPYGETSLKWDRWVDGWPTLAGAHAKSMWCFGSMRMFLGRRDEFSPAGWKLSQEIVWEKNNGSCLHADRFRRVHELIVHWYRGPWNEIYHQAQRVPSTIPSKGTIHRKSTTQGMEHFGGLGRTSWIDDGTRLATSVQRVRSAHGSAIHPTEKPVPLLRPLIEYACPARGLILDLFAGSGSTLHTARLTGRRAVGIEAHEPYAEAAARRLSQGVLDLDLDLDLEPDGDAT